MNRPTRAAGGRHSRPFVDRPVTDHTAALAAARQALRGWGMAGQPEPLRAGMNAIFDVPGTGAVVRVGHATAPAAAGHALAGTLAAAGVATVRAVDGWVADIDGFAVSGWERVPETRRAVDWEAIGATVDTVHQLAPSGLPADYPLPSPTVFAWWQFETLLGEVGDDLDAPARVALAAAIERNSWWLAAVGEQQVVCHGDVHPGNVLVAAEGPLLIDWDLLCWAPPAWDHAVLLTWGERWGGAPDVYPRFAAGYGRSFADDPLTLALGELRNVAATLMRVRAGRTDAAAAAEAERRLRYWRGDPDAPAWRAQ